jgi:hypothetical protein
MDQLLDNVSFINNGRLQTLSNTEFSKGISQTATYMSFGPTREKVIKIK